MIAMINMTRRSCFDILEASRIRKRCIRIVHVECLLHGVTGGGKGVRKINKNKDTAEGEVSAKSIARDPLAFSRAR